MDKATTLFRVFDIAFFAPGAVVFIALMKAGYLSEISLTAPLNTSGGAIMVLVAIAAVYVLGLICHALQRFVGYLIWKRSGKGNGKPDKSWYQKESSDKRYELATYFWYVRATCWNLSVALLLSFIGINWGAPTKWGAIALLVLGSLALFWLGFDFDRALNRAVEDGPQEATNSSATPVVSAPNAS